MREVLIMMTWKCDGQEGGELQWTIHHVVAKTHVEILKSAMVVTVVNRKLMRIRSLVFANSVRKEQVYSEPVGNAVVDFLYQVIQSDVAIIVAGAIAVKVISREQVLIADCYLTFALGRYPSLAGRGGLGE